MLIRKKLPSEVTDDIISWLTVTSIPRMNKNVLLKLVEEKAVGEIELDIAGNSLLTFLRQNLHLPQGQWLSTILGKFPFLVWLC